MAKRSFIRFEESEQYSGRPTYRILNRRSGTELGQIGWYPRWKCFTVHFEDNSVWSADCLDDVQRKLTELNRGGNTGCPVPS